MQRFRLSCSGLRPRPTLLQLTKAHFSSRDSLTSLPLARRRRVEGVALTDVLEGPTLNRGSFCHWTGAP